ncbi:MAG: ABC transporter ATP-binding protein [Eubacterium sp.]|nr:ABC transporter ATP-binding protein [Eubacterium sp.]
MAVMELRGLTKAFGPVLALDHIDLDLEEGNIVGLLGPNGSGKTTLIKLATGLLSPSAGEIRIAGMLPGPETKARVAYLPDRDFLPGYMKVDQLMKFYRDFFVDFDRERAEAMIADLGLPRNMALNKMSKGTREKLQLIMTMSRRAKVYLLDEPIAGVDPAARDYILRTIIGNYSRDSLVLISTHLIADVESVLDDVVFLKNGRVVLHRGSELIREETGKSVDALFREVFKC